MHDHLDALRALVVLIQPCACRGQEHSGFDQRCFEVSSQGTLSQLTEGGIIIAAELGPEEEKIPQATELAAPVQQPMQHSKKSRGAHLLQAGWRRLSA